MTTAQLLKKAKSAAGRDRNQSRRRILSTRAHIIEIAGQVFAEKGYHGATGKEICERAEVNAASISYHFGGMDALYHEVLLEAYDALMGSAEINTALRGAEPAEKRLQLLCQLMTQSALLPVGRSWEMRVISREALSPSADAEELRNLRLVPNMLLLRDLVSEVLGLPVEHTAVTLGCLQILAPIVLLQVGDWTAIATALPGFALDPAKEELCAQYVYTFMLGGLRALAALHAPPSTRKASSVKATSVKAVSVKAVSAKSSTAKSSAAKSAAKPSPAKKKR